MGLLKLGSGHLIPDLTDGDLSAVHVGEELLHVTPGHAVQVHDVVLLPVLILRQQAPVKKKKCDLPQLMTKLSSLD
jgi:hypothetical protein